MIDATDLTAMLLRCNESLDVELAAAFARAILEERDCGRYQALIHEAVYYEVTNVD